MPRKIVPISAIHPYHITARCNDRERFPIPIEEVWSIMGDYLFLLNERYGMQIHSFVLMANHFHLLARAPLLNLGDAMNHFMRESSREINRLANRGDHTWGGRFHRSLINSYHYYMCAYKYVYRNPVRAMACERVEQYPFSTLNRLVGANHVGFPMIEDTLLFNPSFDESALTWLNTCPKKDDDQTIRQSLRRAEFAFPMNKNCIPHPLESRRY
jgi:putative transposase